MLIIIFQKKNYKRVKKRITDLGGTPVKKHLLSSLQKWIDELKLQLEKLKKVEALKTELKKELEALGEAVESNENKELKLMSK